MRANDATRRARSIWHAVPKWPDRKSAADIAAELGLDRQLVSSYLRRFAKDRIVQRDGVHLWSRIRGAP